MIPLQTDLRCVDGLKALKDASDHGWFQDKQSVVVIATLRDKTGHGRIYAPGGRIRVSRTSVRHHGMLDEFYDLKDRTSWMR